jgi:hypothetical protein
MKINFLLLPLFLLLLTGFDRPFRKDPTLINRTVSISDNMSISALEVTVFEWREFILANNNDPALYPDTVALMDPGYRLLFKDLNTQNKAALAIRNYPVVGITYEQALLFCRWKQRVVNGTHRDDQKILISLPSADIYKKVIENTDSLYRKHMDRHKCWHWTFNYKHPPCDGEGGANRQGQSLVRADAYWPTKLRIYNIRGNAAEMTAVKGIAMGGSFRQYAYQCSSDQVQTYSGPQDWLGFRYIVTLAGASSR